MNPLRPLLRQLAGDPLGLGSAARSERSDELRPRTATADRVVQSICPYCAVGCGQKVYVKDERVIQIEGDPDSPISRGRLCPKGSASEQLVNSPLREYRGQVPPPARHASGRTLDLDTAMDMIADRVVATRDADVGGRATDGRQARSAARSGSASSAARRSTPRRTT